jgi:hypothetical protein
MSFVQIIGWPDVAQTVAFGGIGAGYAPVGGPINHPARTVWFQNGTDGDVWISFDGVHNHFPLFHGAFFLWDVTANRTNRGGSQDVPQGTIFYAKRLGAPYTDPTVGSLFITPFYAR